MKDEELLSLFTDMSRIHTAYVERRLLPLGVHSGQGAIISALGKCGPCSQKELAEYRHVSAATISVMLRRMENSGLITRSASEDGKHNQIALTDEGRVLYETLCQAREGEAGRVFAGLSADDLIAAERIFQTLSDNLQALGATDRPS